MKELDAANRLMWEGKKKEADCLLRQAISNAGTRKSIYQDAINIYILGKMYEEAKHVFGQYKARTDSELRGTDLSLEEVEREQQELLQAEREYSSTMPKLFRRMPVVERGSFGSRHHFFSPIREIEIHEGKIILRKGKRELQFYWPEIKEALVTSRWVGGSEYSIDHVEKTFHLITNSGVFRFDVSEDDPDFKHSDILVEELKKHLQVRVEKMKKPVMFLGFEIWWWLTALALLVYFIWKVVR